MADEAVPHHGLEGLRQRGDPIRIDRGNQDHHIAVLGGIAAISTYDPEHFRRTRLGEIDRLDDIRTDIALGIAATDGIDQDRVFLVELADFKPPRKDGVPALVVGTGGEFRNIVDRAIGLDPAELAKVVDGVAAVGRAAADADQEQASFAISQPVEFGCQSPRSKLMKYRDKSARPQRRSFPRGSYA